MSPISTKGAPTYLHVVSTLPTAGAPHAISRSRQNRQAITDLRRALLFVVGSFNTACPALGLCTGVGVGSNDDVSVNDNFHALRKHSRIGRQRERGRVTTTRGI